MGRTRTEKRLKRAINEKNVLSKRLRERTRLKSRFNRLSTAAASRRWQKRYASTAERLAGEVRRLTETVLADGASLGRRIREEMKISEDEVRAFEKRYEKELAEYREARKKADVLLEDYQLAQHTWTSASRQEHDNLHQLEGEAARARAEARKEKKDAEKVQREIESEARDKTFFTLELERISAERLSLKAK